MRGRWVLAVGLATALLAGCGGGSAADTAEKSAEVPEKTVHLQMTLDGADSPLNVGILMAEERGYFADVGLDVEAYPPRTPVRPVKYVVDGTDEVGISHLPQVVLAKEKGAPIVAVGSLIPQSTMAMIWLKGSEIDGIADLEGKTIGVPGLSFQKDFLQSVLRRGGLSLGDVRIRKVAYKLVPALASGHVDAIFGGAWNLEGAELKARGLAPVITRVEDLGVPAYDELVLIFPVDRVSEDPELIRDFLSAVARGTAAAVEDPKAAVEVIEGAFHPQAGRKATEAGLEATLPLFSKTGYMSPERASRLVAWMRAEGMIKRALPVSALLTNDYLGSQPGR
jgi:putative hydroxymethylpyrimidine transport system substrate-binding protein